MKMPLRTLVGQVIVLTIRGKSIFHGSVAGRVRLVERGEHTWTDNLWVGEFCLPADAMVRFASGDTVEYVFDVFDYDKNTCNTCETSNVETHNGLCADCHRNMEVLAASNAELAS